MFDYKEGVDYTLVIPETQNDKIDVKLLSGEFSGVIYNYGKVAVEENQEDESAHLVFEYEVIDSSGLENLEESAEFKNYIGDILVSMIMKNLPSGE